MSTKFRAILVVSLMFSCKEKEPESTESIVPAHTINYLGKGLDLGISQDGKLISIAATTGGVHVYETSQPLRPVYMGSGQMNAPYMTFIDEKKIYAFDENMGLQVINLSSLNKFSLTTALATGELHGIVKDAYFDKGTLHLVNESIGIYHFNFDRNFNLTETTPINTTSRYFGASNIAKTANKIVTASESGQIYIYKQLTDEAPLKSLQINDKILDISCSKNICYLVGLNSGLNILNLQNFTTERRDENLNSDFITSDQNLLFTNYLGLKGSHGFQVYDIENPEFPTLLQSIATPAIVSDIQRIGDTIYVLLENGTLQIYNREDLI